MFPVANQIFLDKRGSDHMPVLVNLLASQEVYKGQFKFNKKMLHKPMVKECVEKAWKSQWCREVLSVSYKIRRCITTLSKWKKENNNNALDHIHQIQVALES